MDQESKKEGLTDPHNPPSSKQKNERSSSNKKKEKKRKKKFRVPPKLLASIWWIATFATFAIGVIGLVRIILQIYLRGGGPDWSYALTVTPLYGNIEVTVYGFKGNKRDLNIRHVANVSVSAFFERDGMNAYAFRRAVQIIPWLSRSSSPVIFAGGGNMRLIRKYNKRNYDKYMNYMNRLLRSSPLKYLPQNVRTLNDWEEALHGWVALNYLSDYMIKGRQPIKAVRDIFTTTMTSGVLDLGQSSLHISYEIPRVLDHIKLEDGVKENTRVITLYGRVYYIYTKSLECYGARRMMDMYITYKLDSYGRSINFPCINKIDGYDGPDLRILSDRLSGTCTGSQYVKQNRLGTQYMYFYGPSNPDECLTEVKEVVNKCGTHFKNNVCPSFDFPKRPYNVTFTVLNEFAIYALLAGLKNGDSKDTWNKKRKKICGYHDIRLLEYNFRQYNNPAWGYRYHHLCLMITYLFYFLSEKLTLSDVEWSRLRIVQDVDKTEVSWYLGYVANITNSLPTSTSFYGEVSIEDLIIEGLIFTSILTISSVTVAFALRNSNVLALRPLQLPQ